ncbi:MAG TPA: aldose 1-epimerase [Pirellulales bacterium]|nr:aldose 1-epimerase [Pirellulales bacterium]
MSIPPVTLHDDQSGATAKILVQHGFNCYSFRPAPAGEPIEVLWAAADFEAGQGKPSHSGIPILFPFAGRLRGSHLTYQGETYPLGSDDGRGNAIHGFVLNRPWRIVEHGSSRLVGEFQASREEPGLLRRWPADFRLTVAYELSSNALCCEINVFHPGEGSLPFGLGLHPYFRLPWVGGAADDYRLTVPAAEYWELTEMLPSGRRLPAIGARDLTAGMPVGGTHLDDVFTGLSHADGVCRASLADPHGGRALEVTFDDSFRDCVIYNPPHREAICIEPYTCVPDAFSLAERGVETGLRVLQPGESFTTRVEIRLR